MPHDSNLATKADLYALEQSILGRFDGERRHAEVLLEKLKHDVLAAFKDFTSEQPEKQEKHERGISR